MPVDMTKGVDRRMVAAIGLLSRAGVGYVGMRNELKADTRAAVANLYPNLSDAEAFVLLAIRFAEALSSSFGAYIQVTAKDSAEAESYHG